LLQINAAYQMRHCAKSGRAYARLKRGVIGLFVQRHVHQPADEALSVLRAS